MEQATIVVLGTFATGYEAVFAEYSRKVRAFLDSKNAIVIRRQLVERTLYGDLAPSLVMTIDFPTRESAETAFFEPEYLALLPLRDRVFSDFQMFLAKPGEV
ncbi:MAG TPA: DUF1330 domain-containing protein [Thermoanaerobaculia bacterium]|nr:DUF1330 domain-containing protein [Thermoanaerobaculia bacterium]